MTKIRGTNLKHFRYGQWADLHGIVHVRGRACYVVRFPDGVTDTWVVSDRIAGYEYKENDIEV